MQQACELRNGVFLLRSQKFDGHVSEVHDLARERGERFMVDWSHLLSLSRHRFSSQETN